MQSCIMVFLFVGSVLNSTTTSRHPRRQTSNENFGRGKFDLLRTVLSIIYSEFFFLFFSLLTFIAILCCVLDVALDAAKIISGQGNSMCNSHFPVKSSNIYIYISSHITVFQLLQRLLAKYGSLVSVISMVVLFIYLVATPKSNVSKASSKKKR